MSIPPFNSPIPVSSGGTVTSVGLSGGSTGLTVSGSPVTTSGTITLGGTLTVGSGGTGATTLTGLVVGNGASAMTAVTAPTGTVVGTTDTQTLTNKTIAANGSPTMTLNGNPVWQYLGSAQISSSFSTSSSTPVQVTGLSVSVTLPSGLTQVRISVCGRQLSSNSTSAYSVAAIWRGTVGTGTKIQEVAVFSPSGGNGQPLCFFGLDESPSSGSTTYNLSLEVTAGTATLQVLTGALPTLVVEGC